MSGFYTWSRTASANASADNAVNWAEGMAPSAVNDSGRGMMASTAKWRDDISGSIVTTGSPTAYAISSYQGFDALAHLDGQQIAFAPHVTNDATVTLNVDGLGSKPLRSAPGVELAGGTLVQGTPYLATYFNSAGEWILHGFYGSNPYNVPIGSGLDYWGDAPPNSAFAFPFGQAISRTTYATAFAIMGTKYGTGDGSATFNLPDKRARLSAPLDNMGGTAANRLTTGNTGVLTNTLGAAGGQEVIALTEAQNGSHKHPAFIRDDGHSHSFLAPYIGILEPGGGFSGGNNSNLSVGMITLNAAPTGVRVRDAAGNLDTTNSSGSGSPHLNVQPIIMCNYIIRIL